MTQRIHHRRETRGAFGRHKPPNEGSGDTESEPTLSRHFRAMRQRKAASMSAEQLKRKLRNFPAARLNERLAA